MTKSVLDAVREVVDQQLPVFERRMLSGEPFADLVPELDALRATVRGTSAWVGFLPAEAGGGAHTLPEFAHLAEAMGRSPLGHYVFNCQAPDAGNMELLLHAGTPAQQERWLRPLVAGDIRSCFTMTEPGRAGSNPVWMDTQARREGGDWVITGHKWFATGAEGSDLAVCMAITDPDGPPHARASLFLVPTDTPGWQILRNLPVMGESGSGWASHAEVHYDEVRVPASALLGEVGQGFALAQTRLGPGRIHHCMRWIGIAERVIELTARQLLDRELGPGDPLATRQAQTHALAHSRIAVEASRSLVLDVAAGIHRDGTRTHRTRVAAIKVLVANMLQSVLDRAIQAHGGAGLLDEGPIAWWYRHERAARIYDGPDEAHLDLIARHELRRHREP